jgi:RNA polymerase sigma-70 factor (subfamily 1)
MDARSANLPTHAMASPLLRAAKGGSQDARGQLLDLYWQFLVTVAAEQIDSKLGRKVGPSDVAQETVVRAGQHFEKFTDGSVREWEAWLRTLAQNTIADLRRRYRRKKRNIARERSINGLKSRVFLEKLSTLGKASPDQALADRETAAGILAVVHTLRESHQAILVWHFRDGLGLAEISAKLDRSEDAVRMLLNRAVSALRKKLGHADE